jgi:hypothetical protein
MALEVALASALTTLTATVAGLEVVIVFVTFLPFAARRAGLAAATGFSLLALLIAALALTALALTALALTALALVALLASLLVALIVALGVALWILVRLHFYFGFVVLGPRLEPWTRLPCFFRARLGPLRRCLRFRRFFADYLHFFAGCMPADRSSARNAGYDSRHTRCRGI